MKFFYKFISKFSKFKNFIRLLFKRKSILYLNKYSNYKDYISHQVNKTSNPEKIKKWKNEEWEIKYNGFKEIFTRNEKFIRDKKNDGFANKRIYEKKQKV